MYIRETLTKNKKTGAIYAVHRLVEAVRTPKGPRQRVVLHLGTLSLSKVDRKKLVKLLEARLLGQKTLFENEAQLVKIADEALANLKFRKTVAEEQQATTTPDIQAIDLNSLGFSKTRSAGPEILGHYAWKTLEFPKMLRDIGLSDVEISLAEASILGRLIHPGSERETHSWINQQSALPELISMGGRPLGRNGIYEIADTLLSHKVPIEKKLRKTEIVLFPSSMALFLYDLTNTYFEGQAAGNDLAKRGHSKEKRNDRPLVTLALLVDAHGFPVFSQIYRGNQAEPATLASVLTRLEEDSKGLLPDCMPTIVMDKGIATSDNVQLIRKRGFPYAIVERRRVEKDYESDFADPSGFTMSQTRSGPIRLKKVLIGDRAHVLVISEGRVAKERAMDALKEKRFQEEVERLDLSVKKGNVILPEKVGRRIGRILQRYPSMASYYEIVTANDSAGAKVTNVSLKRKETSQREETILGCYVIETSHHGLEAKKIWDLYTALHSVEKAFRCLKTDLGIRPVHHQLAARTEGHLFISVLAYHLLVVIEKQLREAGDHRSWATIRNVMSTLVRGTITCATGDGQAHKIRVTGALEPEHRDILQSLKIESPFKRLHRRFQVRM